MSRLADLASVPWAFLLERRGLLAIIAVAAMLAVPGPRRWFDEAHVGLLTGINTAAHVIVVVVAFAGASLPTQVVVLVASGALWRTTNVMLARLVARD